VEKLHRDSTVGTRPKIWTRGQKWNKYSTVIQRRRLEEAQIRNNPEGGELDSAEGVRRRYKKNQGQLRIYEIIGN